MYLRFGCRAFVAALVGVLAVVAPATAAHAAAGCKATYSIQAWPTSGFTAYAQLWNTGDQPWNEYNIEFRFTGNQTVTGLWNHTWAQTGQSVTARSATWQPPVRPGQAATLGFTASHDGTNDPPVDWRVNGVPCATPNPPAVIADRDYVELQEGARQGFALWLSHPPAQPVTLHISTSSTGGWVMTPATVTFTPADWNHYRSFTVTSTQDADKVDDRLVLTLSVDGYVPASVTFQQIDDD
ncbi:cellulose binding domain-containing protein [Phytohabitans kaempferiae]|uniref:Cellulose binding domain-containing protein n=1 Tax=Phytohabitans kaempferiae TaxID=1620943 RepID=A0ABV6M768_9ACTN